MAVTLTFGGLDLMSGTPETGGYHCKDEIPLDGDSVTWDVVRSYDGSLRQVDYHVVPWPMSLRIAVYGTSAADLESKLSALRAACLAGGALTITKGGSSRSYTIWPSTPPVVPVDPVYCTLYWALATCTLTVCP